MSKLIATTPFDGFHQDFDGLSIQEISGFEIVSLAVVSGEAAKFAKAFKKAVGGALPAPGSWTETKTGRVLWTGQDQYFLFSKEIDDRLDEKLSESFEGLAYASLQTDGWSALDVYGPQVHDVLERFIPLDLRGAATGYGTRTAAHHMSVIVMKTGEQSCLLLTPTSSSGSFLESLLKTTSHTLQI